MISLIIQAFIVSVIGGIIFSIIGIIPGTDETATMAPATLILVLMGVEPVVLLSWIIGIMCAMQITHTIPTAMAALPGSTMAVPMVYHCNLGKQLGVPHIMMRKMAAGSLLGSVIAIPIAILVAIFLSPLGDLLSEYSGILFTVGAIIIALMSNAKWGGVVALIPYAFLIQGMQRLSVEVTGSTVFTSIFMGITIGPMIAEIFNVFIPHRKKLQHRDKENEIWLAPESKSKLGIFPNPFKLLTKKQLRDVGVTSAISSCTFTMSPVGMTVLLGETVSSKRKELYDKITSTVGVQDAICNATYIAELIIPMLAFGLPLSPIALGVGAPLFTTINLHDFLTLPDYFIFGIIGLIGGSIIAYPIAIKKARKWTELMFRVISHEALIGAFLGLICMLAFYEAGLFGIVVALSVGMFGGILHNIFSVHTGVQFMAYYASSWLVTTILSVCAMTV